MVDGVKGLEVVSTILVMIAVPLIAIPRRFGIWIMLASQITWASWAYFKGGTHFFFFQCLYLIFFNIIALYQWKKKGIG